jgi:hypothetical protein
VIGRLADVPDTELVFLPRHGRGHRSRRRGPRRGRLNLKSRWCPDPTGTASPAVHGVPNNASPSHHAGSPWSSCCAGRFSRPACTRVGGRLRTSCSTFAVIGLLAATASAARRGGRAGARGQRAGRRCPRRWWQAELNRAGGGGESLFTPQRYTPWRGPAPPRWR